jgi:integrase
MAWLPKIQAKELSALSLYHFSKWAGKTPTELLAMKKDPSSLKIEKLLDKFVATPEDVLGMTNAQKFLRTNAVKSLFKHNYVNIARAAGAIQLGKKKDYNKLSKDGLRKLWNWTQNPRDRCLITFVNSTAVAKETLSQLKWKHLEENWENVDLPSLDLPPEILKGHGKGKYQGVRQITFLTPEAKRDLMNYKEWIEHTMGRKLTPEDHIFLETCYPFRPEAYDTLGGQIWQLSKRTGVPFTLHDARRWVNTRLEQIGISENWARKIRGRKVRGEESPYSQPEIDQLREKFREAVPLLQFTTETPSISKEAIRDEVLKNIEEQRLKETAEKLHIPLEQVRQAFRERAGDWNRLVRDLQKRKPDDCSDGKHCEKIVGENELPDLLTDGWRFVATLPSGKIVVSNENI